MIRAGLLLLLAGLWAAPVLAAPAKVSDADCPARGEAACMLDAAWSAALLLPPDKAERVKPLFAPPALQLTDPKARALWNERLSDTPVDIPYEDYVRRTAESTIREHGWDGFQQLARDGAAPLHMGRPEIMAAAVDLAPDAARRAQLIDLMFTLAGKPRSGQGSGINDEAFEQADFGHVLAERMMRDCKLAEFDRAAALTNAPDALRYRLWRARITGGAGKLAPDIRAGDGSGDTRHVRQALEGYGAILTLGYCAK